MNIRHFLICTLLLACSAIGRSNDPHHATYEGIVTITTRSDSAWTFVTVHPPGKPVSGAFVMARNPSDSQPPALSGTGRVVLSDEDLEIEIPGVGKWLMTTRDTVPASTSRSTNTHVDSIAHYWHAENTRQEDAKTRSAKPNKQDWNTHDDFVNSQDWGEPPSKDRTSR